MLKFFRKTSAQSYMEYTVLIMIVCAAIIAMRQYIQRSIDARMKQVQTDLNEWRR